MNYSSLVLAFIGDSVFELKIREHFLSMGISKVKNLQKETSKYASAKGHKVIVDYFIDNNILSEEELNIYKRGRNAKVNQRRKNFDSVSYHASTGFEALIGALYLNDESERINELIEIIVKDINVL
ncbi:ribonuclease-3 family protein [Bacilli bacterium PM5-3]|nr:ribonuclease-3 family protein [Bacilli bacterium PM5-3]MDH6603390.1 ribonuclease-3 family protein [Bacilli bacterium PM5-9]